VRTLDDLRGVIHRKVAGREVRGVHRSCSRAPSLPDGVS
jgi:hypothetical protein